jgi:hypothetical protein
MDGEPLLGMLSPVIDTEDEPVPLAPELRVGERRNVRKVRESSLFTVPGAMAETDLSSNKEFPR